MRSLTIKTAGVVIAVFMALGFLAAPSASAQNYPPIPPPPADFAAVGAPVVISITDGEMVIQWTDGIGRVIFVTVIIESTPTVIYSGPLPANGTIAATLPADITPGQHTLTINARLADGGTYFTRFAVTVPAAAAPAASTPAAPPATATDADLAFTGGDIQLPIAIGASLVGLGGLALLAARKRNFKF